jgi:hypothetical protein
MRQTDRSIIMISSRLNRSKNMPIISPICVVWVLVSVNISSTKKSFKIRFTVDCQQRQHTVSTSIPHDFIYSLVMKIKRKPSARVHNCISIRCDWINMFIVVHATHQKNFSAYQSIRNNFNRYISYLEYTSITRKRTIMLLFEKTIAANMKLVVNTRYWWWLIHDSYQR